MASSKPSTTPTTTPLGPRFLPAYQRSAAQRASGTEPRFMQMRPSSRILLLIFVAAFFGFLIISQSFFSKVYKDDVVSQPFVLRANKEPQREISVSQEQLHPTEDTTPRPSLLPTETKEELPKETNEEQLQTQAATTAPTVQPAKRATPEVTQQEKVAASILGGPPTRTDDVVAANCPEDAVVDAALKLDPPQRYRLSMVQAVDTTNVDPRELEVSPHRYTFLIEPLQIFGCSNDCTSGQICAGYSFFEVYAHSSFVKLAGTVQSMSNGSWVGEVWLPAVSGQFKIHARLIMENYPRIFDDYKSKEDLLKDLAADTYLRSQYPAKYWATDIAGSPTVLQVIAPEPIAALREGLPFCHARQRLDTPLPGWWDGSFRNYFPYECRLRSVRKDAIEGYDEKFDLVSYALANKWVALFGDSNMRYLFYDICRQLEASKFANKPREPSGKGDKFHACYSWPGDGDPPFLITLTVWWGTLHPRVVGEMQLSAREVLEGAGLNLNLTELQDKVPLWNKLTPDIIIPSMGSHETHKVHGRGEGLKAYLIKAFPEYAKSNDWCQHFMIPLLTPTNPLLIPPKVKSNDLVFVVQNNPRMQYKNLQVWNHFQGCKVLDFFNIAFAPHLAGFVADSVHLKHFVYAVNADLILNYLLFGAEV